ncbi:hypothetical protein JTE90_015999 [Oedothorax gibbosus]|uniref:Uncharacterized protein n=1 Tax=Oedothorax gibbosus TaxID=931172 RepID=A0AAV6VSD7_9ARAC|nr:hypothetical protein JTE90_015999 [Oedothorax gibbosus]
MGTAWDGGGGPCVTIPFGLRPGLMTSTAGSWPIGVALSSHVVTIKSGSRPNVEVVSALGTVDRITSFYKFSGKILFSGLCLNGVEEIN